MADWDVILSYRFNHAFKDEKAIKGLSVDEFIEKVFLHLKRSSIYIYDDENQGFSHFVADTGGLGREKTFMIENRNHRDVFLMKIDGVLFQKKSKCDCAIIWGGEMDFIEFKTKASNKNDDTMEAHYNKIYKQLKLTIEYFETSFRKVGLSFRNQFSRILAYGVFNPTVPTSSATEKILAARFAKEVKVKLMFTNNTHLV